MTEIVIGKHKDRSLVYASISFLVHKLSQQADDLFDKKSLRSLLLHLRNANALPAWDKFCNPLKLDMLWRKNYKLNRVDCVEIS